MRNTTQRLDFIDSVRGIAALLVMFSHAFEYYIDGWKENTFTYFNLGQTGVLSFFMVSGFVIPLSLEKTNSLKKFIISRIFRIYPLYLFVLIINVIIIFFILPLSIDINWMSFAKNIGYHIFFIQTYLPTSAPFYASEYVPGSWTLFIELIWYVLFGLLFYFKSNKKTDKLFVVSSLFLLVIAILSLVLNKRIPLGRICCLYICFIGLLAFRHFNDQIDRRKFIIYIFISILILGFALWTNFEYFKNPMFIFQSVFISYLIGFGVFFVPYYLAVSYNIDFYKPLLYLGKISYSVYLMHAIILELLFYYFGKDPGFIVIVLFLSIAISTFTYRFIEKKGIDLGKKAAN